MLQVLLMIFPKSLKYLNRNIVNTITPQKQNMVTNIITDTLVQINNLKKIYENRKMYSVK